MSVWSSVRCPSLRVCPSPVSLRCLPLLFHTLPALWPGQALLLPCQQRQGKPLRLCPMRSIAPRRYTSSHRLWAQRPWPIPLLRDFWNDLPGGIQRHRYGALVLVWCGSRRWDHRESAIFTTVHLRARRTSGPSTSLSLFWRKFVAKSVLVCLSCENGETRTWT